MLVEGGGQEMTVGETMHTAAKRERNSPSVPQGVDGYTHYIHLHGEYYSAKKRNEALAHDTAWMNLEHVLLSERSHKAQRV